MTAIARAEATPSPRALPELYDLRAWCPAYGSDDATAEKARNLIPAYEEAMKPAEKEEIAVNLHRAISIFTPPDNWNEIARFYLDALSSMPADLVPVAATHVAMNCKFFPKPADFTDAVSDEWLRRRSRLCTLQAYVSWHERKKCEAEKRKAEARNR